MSLPILHSIVAASIAVVCYPGNSLTKDWKFLLFTAALAVSPDLDYLLIYGLHMSYESHRSYTHSIFFALAITLLALIATRFVNAKKTLVCGAALLLHGVLDFLVSCEKGGVKLLYPFSDKRFEFGMTEMFERTNNSWNEFFNQASLELILFAPILLLLLLAREYFAGSSGITSDNYQPD